jgi:hypothetical protein
MFYVGFGTIDFRKFARVLETTSLSVVVTQVLARHAIWGLDTPPD